MDEPLVRAENVGRRFGRDPTATQALHDATCAIYPGELIALTGPSGSGKSTLLHLLGGLDSPSNGTVAWPWLGSRQGLRPGRVVDVFQGPGLLPPLSVLDNVRLPLLLLEIAESEASEAALDALGLFDLEHLRHKLPEEISGGQAQRVAIARALVVRPSLVLADEPTGQLDTATAFAVLDRLLAIVDDIGAAILLSTHDDRVAVQLAKRWTMRDGILRTADEADPRFIPNHRERAHMAAR